MATPRLPAEISATIAIPVITAPGVLPLNEPQ
jgi:hypothetical protein